MSGDIESGTVQKYGTFASRAPAAPAPAAVMGWGHRFANFFHNLTLREKIVLAACGVGVVGAVGLSAYGIASSTHFSKHVIPLNPEQICAALPKVAENYTQWLSSPAIIALKANITETINGLCSGSPVTDPAAIAAAQSTLETLRENIANVSVNIFTGHFYRDRMYPKSDLPNDIFQYVSSCLSEPITSNAPWGEPWYYMKIYLGLLSMDYSGFKTCTLDTLRKVALGGLSILCNWRSGVEPFFNSSGSGYVCGYPGTDDGIQYIASSPYIWPS